MTKRKQDDREAVLERSLSKFLRYTIFTDEEQLEKFHPWWGGIRIGDIAATLEMREEDVWHAVETSRHHEKGWRFWAKGGWVGVNWWPRTVMETCVWPPLGDVYFRCPNEWRRQEDESLEAYIRKWFIWENDSLSDECMQEWRYTAFVAQSVKRSRRQMTFHVGANSECPEWMQRIDVADPKYRISGVPNGLRARDVTGVHRECIKHLITQAHVACAVRDIIMLVESSTCGDEEVAVCCKHGKHRSPGIMLITVATVYCHAMVAFHHGQALDAARTRLERSVSTS